MTEDVLYSEVIVKYTYKKKKYILKENDHTIWLKAADRTQFEVMSIWTHDQPMKTPLVKSLQPFPTYMII
jgi:hypothetical protein